MTEKYVYLFGGGETEGNSSMKNLLGGKGANLAEMSSLGVPVPPGFTISTEMCTVYYKNNRNYPDSLANEVDKAIAHIESIMGKKFGSSENPLLVSVRSGARVSMPGMMDTVLNLGLNDQTVQGLASQSGNERFAWDSYRRFVQMYGDVVLDMKPETEDEEDPFEVIIEAAKKARNVKNDNDLTTDDLKELVKNFKALIKDKKGMDFPDNARDQLWGAINAVFGSWMTKRAIRYRKMNNIPADWGTAVNVQSMAFGNMGNDCATGVAFTRNPATGEKMFYGEYLINAQGEDVVAGIRTPQPINSTTKSEDSQVTLEEAMPGPYKQLVDIYLKLEEHYKDMQDIEFTIERGTLWMLQTRNGKRTAQAAVRIAMEMLDEKMIDEKTAVKRVEPNQLDQLLHPAFDPKAAIEVIAKGLPASPGAASGRVYFSADECEKRVEQGEKVILVRIETSPEDIGGMDVSQGILTARGGMTSHAAVVARGMGKCCVAGCGDISISYIDRVFTVGSVKIKEGDWISLNGSTGEVIKGQVPTVTPQLSGNFGKLMTIADKYRKLGVRTNADTPKDSKVARDFGAEGIGLCRTEHMFFEGDRIKAVREMILASDVKGRETALAKLLPMQRGDFEGIFKAMNGLPVTVRLLDPPLHEFLPHSEKDQRDMAKEMNLTYEQVKEKVDSLHEFNPMLGHRGCRLGLTYPEITRMQARAIIEAACNLKKEGVDVKPEIMIPLIGTDKEFINQEEIVRTTATQVMEEKSVQVDYLVGTMIEVPRAALTADEIAKRAEFFSFGTNDLTQMTCGFSRDDAGTFLKEYVDMGIYDEDPFQSLDQSGVGLLVDWAVRKGRGTRPNIKIGICGEHGGEPKSVAFCHRVGMNYVSCSPYRVPIARLAAAHEAIRELESLEKKNSILTDEKVMEA
jgi:pyruvate,orthophosphate dikinase